jgi:uncharacterized membrane protein YidH (DUF202 family)
MKHFFSMDHLKRTTACMLVILFTGTALAYAWLSWQAIEHWTAALSNYLKHADHYLLSLAN